MLVEIRGNDRAAVYGADQALYRGCAVHVAEQRGVQRQVQAVHGRNHRGNAGVLRLPDPDRRRHGDVAVRLGDAKIVIAEPGGERKLHLSGVQLRRAVRPIPGVRDLAAVNDEVHRFDPVLRIRIGELRHELQHLRDLIEHGAQRLAVDRVIDGEVFVLRGIDPEVSDGLVKPLFGKRVRKDHVPGVVGIAPAPLVIVLIVRGRHVPAHVQGAAILLIAGVIAALPHRPLAVSHLQQKNALVRRLVPIGKIGEIAVGAAGVIELADGALALRAAQQGIICLKPRVVRLVVQVGVVA